MSWRFIINWCFCPRTRVVSTSSCCLFQVVLAVFVPSNSNSCLTLRNSAIELCRGLADSLCLLVLTIFACLLSLSLSSVFSVQALVDCEDLSEVSMACAGADAGASSAAVAAGAAWRAGVRESCQLLRCLQRRGSWSSLSTQSSKQ